MIFSQELDPAVEYLIKNRHYFNFERLKWNILPIFLNKQLVGRVFDLPRYDLSLSLFEDDIIGDGFDGKEHCVNNNS